MNFLYVGIGGALGSMARFWAAGAVARATGPAFPYGTILINILGSFVIGWFAGLAVSKQPPSPDLRAFVMAGLCGGFTTFSAFSLQTFELMREGRTMAAAANVCVSVVLCVAVCGAGLALGRS